MQEKVFSEQYDTERTIVAIATPQGEGALGMVRISGPRAVEISDSLFRGNKELSQCEPQTVHFGRIVDGNKEIDEVIAIVYREPNSYTGDDMIEFTLHGSQIALEWLCELLLQEGAELAQPGEFTFRRFLNGKIDLLQAEAVVDVINSSTKRALETAVNQLEGRLSDEITPIQKRLRQLQVDISAYLDFPEQEFPSPPLDEWKESCGQVIQRIDELVKGFKQGKILKEGFDIAIAGRTNVGKSSIFNRFVDAERVIVSPRPGTTRDIVEVTFNIAGFPVKLYDTAGFRITEDSIELEGVRRAEQKITEADLVLLILDGSTKPQKEDLELIDRLEEIEYIPILNKSDLGIHEIFEKKSFFLSSPVITSALENKGIQKVEKKVEDTLEGFSRGNTVISSVRHKRLLEKARNAAERATERMELQTLEIAGFEIGEAMNSIAKLLGEDVSEGLLERIFSQFCVGK